jgi:thiamine biosynthesis lipoprotein
MCRHPLLVSLLAFVVACHEQSPTAASASASAVAAPQAVESAPSAAPPRVTTFEAERVTAEGQAMGTHVAFTAFTTPMMDASAVRRAFDDALAEIKRLEALMTTWRSDSEISRVNEAAGKAPVKVGPETFEVIQEALHTSEISEGTFDITFESLHGVWKFDEDLDPHPPKEADVKARLPLVDWRRVKIDKASQTVQIERPGVRISLGGIAKGYAVDKAAATLVARGLSAFYVQAGGDLYTKGTKPDGSAWMAGIRDPRGPADRYFAVLPVSDHAFSTAGDYERSYVIGGKRYHHIIDPRTGYPATASRSVTIWAPTALLADAIDDAVFILGPKKGLALVESLPDCGAVIVDAKNNLWVSKRLEGRLRLTAVPTDAP